MARKPANDRRSLLERSRDRLAAQLEFGDERWVPNVSRELRAVLAELDGLPAAKDVTTSDRIAEQRARRRAEAGVPARSPRADQRRSRSS